ncbi:ion channel [Prosthecochloris sp.]|uniref:ion channel n=1 Tax=Prosthecochloris sp. TaxID=290513 RepID=UPI0025EE7CBA|nr:ion channel [Prosthecochloris sp.]
MESPIEDGFIRPGFDLGKEDDGLQEIISFSKEALRARWDTKKGRQILRDWKASHFDRDILDSLIGRFYQHTDIRGIPLQGENMEDTDLSKVDLFGADMEKAHLRRSNLRDSWLSESNIKGAVFDWAELDQARFDNVKFDNTTSFVGVNLNAINFTLAAILQDLAINQQRIASLESAHPKFALFLRVTCDYGRSFTRFFGWATGVILFFGLLYFLIPGAISQHGILNSVYFSFVTFTTLGFGDITPVSMVAKLLVIVEVVMGYIMLGLLVAIVSRRVIGG